MDEAEQVDVAVIGGGVAGLMAARVLASMGACVVVLEARGRSGGRILTRRPMQGPAIELGAGFVHGDNEILWDLVQEAGVQTGVSPERQWVRVNGELRAEDDLWDRLGAVMKKIDPDNHGSFGSWLHARPAGISEDDLSAAREFVENFHGGTAETTSAAVLHDTVGGTDESQHVVQNGYDRVPMILAQQCYAAGVRLFLNTPVQSIEWERGRAIVAARPSEGGGARVFRARAAIVTVPLGVLKAVPGQLGAIEFNPPLVEKQELWRALPVGHVSRLTLRFRPGFWGLPLVSKELRENQGENFGFVHTKTAPIPVWWSAAPEPVLIGWAGGPAARALAGKTKEAVVELALKTLHEIFGGSPAAWAAQLEESFWHDWSADPYSRGGYSFTVAGWEDAPQRLRASVDETLFFAGEATSDVTELGTVGGALSSGERAAQEVFHAVPFGPRAAMVAEG